MRRQSWIRPASVCTIATVTSGLMLYARQHIRSTASPATVIRAAPATSSRALIAASSAEPLAPSPDWKIAYEASSPKSGTGEIWTADADGSHQRRILTYASTPCWSPDRHHIAFDRGGNVWAATADGSAQRQVTFWPPNQRGDYGEYLGLEGISWNAHANIISFGRKERCRLTLSNGRTDDYWATTIYHASLLPGPRSKRFPFVESPTASAANYKDYKVYPGHMDLPAFDMSENHSPFRFSQNSAPAWSPSGNRLAFVRNGDIWLAEHDPSDDRPGETPTWIIERIVACALYDDSVGYGDHENDCARSISWSPDERFLIYLCTRIDGSGYQEVFQVRLKHDRNSPRTESDGQPKLLPMDIPRSPTVSPDGKWILDMNGDDITAQTLDGKVTRTLPIKGGCTAVW